METKLKIALWALLVIYSGSVVLSQDQAASASSPADRSTNSTHTEAPDLVPAGPDTARPALTPSLDSHTTPTQEDSNGTTTSNTSSGTNAKSDNSTSTVEDEAAVQHLSPQHDSLDNATSQDLPVPTFPKTEANLTDQSPPQPRLPPSEDHMTTPHVPLTTTTDSLLKTAHTTTTTPILLTAPPQNTQPSSTHPDKPLHPTSPPSHPNQPSTHPPESQSTPGRGLSSTPARARPETAISVTSRPSSTSDTNSPHETTEFQPPHASHATPDSNRLPGTSSPAHPKSTSAPASNPSAQANAHADIPSQLNVGGDATVVHETPTLDPLLAGLVSAFIITAVIITLLLFLKLRRRDNQPEFRRLQDLPMDDMMEDTPLSMYSY